MPYELRPTLANNTRSLVDKAFWGFQEVVIKAL